MKHGWRSLRAQGKCGWCGGAPIEGKSMCQPCLSKAALKNREYRAGQRDGQPTGGKRWAGLTALGRCARRHLLLPCVCLPTIEEVATGRRAGGEARIETGGSRVARGGAM